MRYFIRPLMVLSLFIFSFITGNAQTATLTPSVTTVLTGGTINFQVITSGFGGNGNNRSFAYTVSGPAPVTPSPTNFNCNSGCNDETHSIQFNTAGEYTVSVTVKQTEGGSNEATSSSVTVNVASPNLWATNIEGTRVSSYAVLNGALVTAGSQTVFTLSGGRNTHALGMSLPQVVGSNPPQPYFYWLRDNFNDEEDNVINNNGVAEVWGATAAGTNQTLIGTLDLNGVSNNELGFVRFGMGPDGFGYILAGDGTTVYLASFKPNGVTLNSALPVNDRLKVIDADGISLIGGTAADFQNGDLAVLNDATNGGVRIYALANTSGTGGGTRIYVGNPNGNNTTFTKVWDLVTPANTPFTGSVNGCAFDSQGSMYITTSAGGIFFINQATVNSLSPGTVVTSLVSPVTGLSDLATNFFPQQSSLPVRLTQFNASLNQSVANLNWLTEAETDFSHFEIERSVDGAKNFKKVGLVNSLGQNGGRTQYHYSDNLANEAGSTYAYRLKMVDTDQSFTYSNVIVIRKSLNSIQKIALAPNPVAGKTATLQFKSTEDSDVQIRIIDLTGRLMLQQQNKANTGMNSIGLQNLERLQPGNYILQIVKDKETNYIKFSNL